LRRLITVTVLLMLTACSTPPAPVIDRSNGPATQTIEKNGVYRIRRGDTLHAIAFRFGIDHRDLARWNQIEAPYLIYPDQILKLTRPVGGSSPGLQTPANNGKTSKPVTPPAKVPKTTAKPAPKVSAPVVRTEAPMSWLWPVQGRLIRGFVANDPARNGLDISASEGQGIIASAAGTVVYSGNGLIGFGELIIIKHSELMLSAYAHNRVRLVAEGAQVKQGQKIAELGRNDRNEAILHFEIRVNGRPVDPRKYLPKN
jgi:lipoprotein NlpD